MRNLFENFQEYEDLYEEEAEKSLATKAKQKLAKGKDAVVKYAKTKGGKRVLIGAGAAAAAGGGVIAAKKIRDKKKKKLHEAVDWGLSPNQYLFDREVVENLKNISESEELYYEGLNNYYISQAEDAYNSGNESVADYYARKVRK
jgi:hypothetical protein